MNYVVHPYMIQAILEGVLKSSQPGSHLKITKLFFFYSLHDWIGNVSAPHFIIGDRRDQKVVQILPSTDSHHFTIKKLEDW